MPNGAARYTRHRGGGPGAASRRGYSLSDFVAVAAARASPPADVDAALLAAARLTGAAARASVDVPPAVAAALPAADAARRHLRSEVLELGFIRHAGGRGGVAVESSRRGAAEHRAAVSAQLKRADMLLRPAARAADIALVAASSAVAMSFGGAGTADSVAAVVDLVDSYASASRADRFCRRPAAADTDAATDWADVVRDVLRAAHCEGIAAGGPNAGLRFGPLAGARDAAWAALAAADVAVSARVLACDHDADNRRLVAKVCAAARAADVLAAQVIGPAAARAAAAFEEAAAAYAKFAAARAGRRPPPAARPSDMSAAAHTEFDALADVVDAAAAANEVPPQ